MKKTLALFSCLLLFGVGWVFGQQSENARQLKENGQTWQAMSLEERVFYVNGFWEGYSSGLTDGYIAAKFPPRKGELDPFEDLKQPGLVNSRGRISALNAPSHTAGEVINTMSVFYQDFRNLPVCWAVALKYSVESLSGHPPPDHDLAVIRAADAQVSCGQ
jgi:hypothetical protein